MLLAAVIGYGLWYVEGTVYGFGTLWIAVALFGFPVLLCFVYLGQERSRELLRTPSGTMRGVYVFLAAMGVYGLWFVNGTVNGFSLAWILVALFGQPLVLALVYLGQEGSRKFFRTPIGALLLGLDIAVPGSIFLFPGFGWSSLIIFLFPVFMWWGAGEAT